MTQKQHDKHILDKQLTVSDGTQSELTAAEPTPDGLGTWEGGRTALKGAPNWVSLKSKPSRTADSKRAPGIDYPAKVKKQEEPPVGTFNTAVAKLEEMINETTPAA
jgi:hypothetical protein